MNISMKNGNITIDGKSFTGSSVNISGKGKLNIDGVVQDGDLVGDINIVVNGNVESIENENGTVKCINTGSVKTVNGDVSCGDVSGDVKTVNGNIVAAKIIGKVSSINGNIN